MKESASSSEALISGAGVALLLGLALGMKPQQRLPAQILTPEQKEILSHMSIVGPQTIRISGVNVQIVDGTGSTDGPVNGVGNLFLGDLSSSATLRTGSHNIRTGDGHTMSSYGCLLSGSTNIASGAHSVVFGWMNEASGPGSVVSGGHANRATGQYSWIGGGGGSTAAGDNSAVTGGEFGTAFGNVSSVNGGFSSFAAGVASSVCGGDSRAAVGTHDWAAGSLIEDH